MAKINSINDGVAIANEMGFTRVNYMTTCVTCVKKSGGMNLVVSITDDDQFFPVQYENAELDYDADGTITFNGESLENWKTHL